MDERALILAPRGRDAALAAAMLAEAGIASAIVPSLPAMVAALGDGAGLALVTEEALAGADVAPLDAWRAAQPGWSDFPFILLTRGGGLERNPAALRAQELLGNVTFIERPFHPTTLVSLARSALRGRRKQYEARARLDALHRSEGRFRAAIDAVEGVLWTNSADGRMEGEQPGWAALTGQPFEDYQGFGWSNAVHPDDKQPSIDSWNEALARGGLYAHEHRVCHHDKVWRNFSIRAVPIFGAEGALAEWVGVHTDITERRRAETALKDLNATLEVRVAAALAERKLFADIFETTDSLVLVVDFEFRLLAINPAAAAEFARVHGRHPAVGRSLLDTLADRPEHAADVRAAWGRALAGEEFTATAPFGNPAHDRRTYEFKFNTLRDADGTAIGAFQVATDVTRREEDAARLAETEDALRQSQKMEAIGQLTGGVAHDFNNLLTVIRASSELLQRPDLSEEKRVRYLRAITDTADRAARLTSQLLSFSRRQALRPELIDIGARVEGIADMLRTVLGARVVLDIAAAGGGLAMADVSQLENAVVNLCVNARDAMDGEGRVEIGVEALADTVRLSVTDSGPGIPADILPRIFEPFFTTKAAGQGTGLGLSQVYGFAKQTGGDITAVNAPGGGARFTIAFPRSRAEMAVPVPAGVPARAARGGRILIVEDNDEIRAFAAQLLGDVGYATQSARDADEALRALEDDPAIDLVFTDVVMPGRSGIDLAHDVRRRSPDLPIVLTSGYSDALARAEGAEFALLPKPYSGAQLIDMIEARLR